MTKINAIFKDFNPSKTINSTNNDQKLHKQSSTNSNSNKKDTLIYSIAGTGVILALIAFWQRKNIVKFIKKIFNKVDPDDVSNPPKLPPQGKTGSSSNPPSIPPSAGAVPAIVSKIPEPKFTCGPENPTKYAQEKKAYLDSIIDKLNLITTTIEDQVKIINAIEKYGTWEQGEKITGLMGFDEDIIQAVVRAIAETATNPDDVLIITKYIRTKKHNYRPETYIQILNSAAKLGDVRSLGDDSKIMLDPIKKLLTHENADVRKAAQDALTAVTTKTGDIKIARN